MIVEGGRPVGYLRWEPPPPEDLAAAGLSDLPDHLVDIDIMIGEPDALGRGIGPKALGLLLDRFRADPRVEWAGLGTSLSNHRAIRAFEKAGFQRFREIADPEIGPGLYLVKDLRPDPDGRRGMVDNDLRPDPEGRRDMVDNDLRPDPEGRRDMVGNDLPPDPMGSSDMVVNDVRTGGRGPEV